MMKDYFGLSGAADDQKPRRYNALPSVDQQCPQLTGAGVTKGQCRPRGGAYAGRLRQEARGTGQHHLPRWPHKRGFFPAPLESHKQAYPLDWHSKQFDP
jgi:hypothetical protein